MIAALPLLRTWYVGYVVLVFVIGGFLLWPKPDALWLDGLLYIAVFIVGYWLWNQGLKPKTPRQSRSPFAVLAYPPSPSAHPRAATPLALLTRLLILLLVVRLGVIAVEVLFVYGIRDYFSGAALAFQIGDYGRLDVASGWSVILTSILNFTTIAACAYYFTESLVQKTNPNLVLVTALMVGVPILALQRSAVLFGVAFVGVAYIFAARVTGQKVAGKVLAAVIALVLALGAGVLLGLLRENAVNQGPVSRSLGSRVLSLAESEMTPIVVYAAFKADVGRVIPYQYGKPIVAPLLFKVVPRNWYPNKPTNSAAYYASHYAPGAFAAGFAIAPTFWGALYLNFGYLGTLLGSFGLGMVTARLDGIYVERRVEELGWFLIVYYNFYALLRDDISNVLGMLILTGAVYLVLQWAAKAKALPALERRLSRMP